MPRLFISTTEASAELHASKLVEALFASHPGLGVDAAGTALLAGTGANLVVDMSGQAVMGVWAVLPHLAFYRQAARRIMAALEGGGYDVLVVVDASSFHLHLAKKVHARWPDLPIVYYIAPKLWVWKKWRVKNLRRDIRKTLCIFPFEEGFLRGLGVDAVYVGNPTLDQVRDLDGKTIADQFGVSGAKRHNEPERGLLAVFPGSRRSEVKYLWPIMVKALEIVRGRFSELKVAVALAPGWTRDKLGFYAPTPEGVMYVEDASQQVLAASSLVLAKSGTTTLEAGLMGKPMVVCYAMDMVTYHIGRQFLQPDYASLPNIVSDQEIVKEFIQSDASAENLAAELERMLADRRYYRKMRSRLLALRDTFGGERAAERAAREIAVFFDKG